MLCDNGFMSMEPNAPLLARLAVLLAEQPDIQLAIVFGSLTSGRLRADSDVDVAVLADEPLSQERKARLIELLAQTSARPVDLVDLRSAGVPIMRSALLGGRRLLCRDKAAYASLLSRMLSDSADFLPYRERLLRQRRDAWIR